MIKKIITGYIKTLTGLHIGTGEITETTDSPIYRNVNGDIVIPGTAIAGALRSLATRIAPYLGYEKCIALDENPQPNKNQQSKLCNCVVCDLFGPISIGKGSEEGEASKLWIYDAVLINNIKTSIRDGIGIDRETGTSSRKARAKYDFEVVPKNSLFSFRIALQENVSEKEERLLSCVLAEWQNGRGYLGGNVARGVGNIQLKDIKVFSINLSDVNTLIRFLKEEDEIRSAEEEKDWLERNINKVRQQLKDAKDIADNEYFYNSFAQIDLTLKFRGGFVINDILKSFQSGFDFCPKIENGRFVFPGSSFRGILRSHAEKIARSLVTLSSSNERDFLNKCPACNPFADKEDPLTSCNVLFRKYKDTHKDEEIKDNKLCLACQVFGSSFKGSRLYVSDGEMVNSPKIKIMDFLAIDRFTGGGKEGAKFDAIVLWQPKFRLRIFIENPKEWQLGWLMLVMKDLKEGLVSFGFGKNKWFGKATVEDEKIKVGAISNAFIPQGLKKGDSYEGIFNIQILKLKDLTKNNSNSVELWIKEFHKVLSNLKRKEDFIPASDTYFKKDVFELYPREVKL
ncbi:hypothetical protein JCM12298_31170 [Desulfothermus naphthae]